MLAVDQIHWVVVSLRGAALRSFLTLLGIAIGIAAVIWASLNGANGAGLGAALFLSDDGFALGDRLARQTRQVDLEKNMSFHETFVAALAFAG